MSERPDGRLMRRGNRDAEDPDGSDSNSRSNTRLSGTLGAEYTFFERGRDRTAGMAFGLGAAVKLFPLVVVPPLAARRWVDGR